jgi:hypothetical protein
MTFNDALKRLPICIGGLDPLRHRTIDDLRWLVIFEIDLYEEGDEQTDIRNQRDLAACRRFLVITK